GRGYDAAETMGLSVERLSKSYGTVRAVADVTLGVPPDSTLALLGPSGCGKSTLLKLVAGLERPDEGRVLVSGRDVTDLPPQRRDLGMVFQDFALSPHLGVADNVAFGLVERRWPAERRRARVAEMLKLVGLEGLGGRRVTELSGGQQQRVALARAMAPEPGLLLLDEPLSNLDEALRAELREEVARLLASQGAEAVYVTHDQVEAFAIADTVAVMRAGRIVQVGTAHDLLTSPADAWTARFLGHDNVWEGAEARRVAAAAGLPAAPTARGVVGGARREGLAWRLRLDVPAWGATVTWRGHERELGGAPAVGAEYELLVPAGAWLSLPAAREP